MAPFHDGWTWHGSGVNGCEALGGAHWWPTACPPRPRFHPDTTGYLYSRYKRFGDDTMDESFFPITWRQDGLPVAFPSRLSGPPGRLGRGRGQRRSG